VRHQNLGLLAAALLATAPATASNLVINGGFEALDNGADKGSNLTSATGWAVTSPGGTYSGQGYSLFFAAGSADTSGATDNNPLHVGIWGPGNGAANGFTGSSPTGGNYFASDADPAYASKISQTISGLTIGQHYTLTFNWAGAQLYCAICSGFNGATSESFIVGFGGQTQSTGVVSIASHGFSGWMSETMYFTAQSGTQVLSFLSGSGPSGLPPMALLDGVSVAVPEPATWALMIAGFALTGVVGRRRRRAVVAA
jgi:hypothetical protein